MRVNNKCVLGLFTFLSVLFNTYTRIHREREWEGVRQKEKEKERERVQLGKWWASTAFVTLSFILLPYFLAATNNHFFSFHSIPFHFVSFWAKFISSSRIQRTLRVFLFGLSFFCFFGNKFNDFLQPNFCCTRNVWFLFCAGRTFHFFHFYLFFWFFFALFVLLRLYVVVVFIFFIRSFSLLEFIGQQQQHQHQASHTSINKWW